MEHDGGDAEYASTRIVATWPKGSFAENVAVDREGRLFVSLHTDRAVVCVDARTGRVTPFATFDTPVAGLAFARDGTLIVSGGSLGSKPGVIWSVTAHGSVCRVADIPEAAFLNGVTPLGDRFLVVDSLAGVVYAVDPRDGAVTSWLADPALAATDASGTPGANGIKLFGGEAYISVTCADRILRVPVSGEAAGRAETHAERLRADDFAIGTDGSFFIATHPARSLMRLAPDGTRTTLASAEHGMMGATAVAFGRTPQDRTSVYVTTTGGTMTVPPDDVEEAKLVRVDVGVDGAPLIAPA